MNTSDSPAAPRSSGVNLPLTVVLLLVFALGLALGLATPRWFKPAGRSGPPDAMGGRPAHFGPRLERGEHGRPGLGRGGERGDFRRGPAFREGAPGAEQREYAAKVKALAEGYREKIKAVLSAEQKSRFDGMIAQREGPGPGPAPGLMGLVFYRPQAEHWAKALELSDKQKASVDQILQQRRAEFLKFVDQNPPPRLAPLAMQDGPPPLRREE